MTVCVLVCLFSIEIQTAGQIRMKFGTEVVLEGGKVLMGVSTRYPPPGYRVRKGGTGCHCLAIPLCLNHHTKPYIKIIF